MVRWLNNSVSRHPESAAHIIPDRDAKLVTSFGKAQESIAAVAANVAACAGVDLAPCHVAPDVILRTVGGERDFRSVQDHQQLGLVVMQPCQQAIQRDEAGTAEENPVEPRTQCNRPTLARLEAIRLQTGVEVPDQAANPLWRGTMLVGKRVELMHQPFRMHPAQRMSANIELPGVIAQNHRIAEELVRLNAAPPFRQPGWRPRNAGPHTAPSVATRTGSRVTQFGEAKPVKMRLPCGLIGEARLRLGRQAGDQRRGP